MILLIDAAGFIGYRVAKRLLKRGGALTQTKRTNELMMLRHCPCPSGQLEMALFLLTKNLIADVPAKLLNQGNHTRFVDDIAEGVIRASDQPAQPVAEWEPIGPAPATSKALCILNIGNNKRVKLTTSLKSLEEAIGGKPKGEFLPLQPGEMPETFADMWPEKMVSYRPSTTVRGRVSKFAHWSKSHYTKGIIV